MKFVTVLLLLSALPTLAFAQASSTTSPDLVALQQMFATAQTGEFNALRDAAQLRAENAALQAEVTKLRAAAKASGDADPAQKPTH